MISFLFFLVPNLDQQKNSKSEENPTGCVRAGSLVRPLVTIRRACEGVGSVTDTTENQGGHVRSEVDVAHAAIIARNSKPHRSSISFFGRAALSLLVVLLLASLGAFYLAYDMIQTAQWDAMVLPPQVAESAVYTTVDSAMDLSFKSDKDPFDVAGDMPSISSSSFDPGESAFFLLHDPASGRRDPVKILYHIPVSWNALS